MCLQTLSPQKHADHSLHQLAVGVKVLSKLQAWGQLLCRGCILSQFAWGTLHKEAGLPSMWGAVASNTPGKLRVRSHTCPLQAACCACCTTYLMYDCIDTRSSQWCASFGHHSEHAASSGVGSVPMHTRLKAPANTVHALFASSSG